MGHLLRVLENLGRYGIFYIDFLPISSYLSDQQLKQMDFGYSLNHLFIVRTIGNIGEDFVGTVNQSDSRELFSRVGINQLDKLSLRIGSAT